MWPAGGVSGADSIEHGGISAVFVSSRNAPERRSGPFQFKAAGLTKHSYFNLSRI